MNNKKEFKELFNNIKENDVEIQRVFESAKKEKKILNILQLITCLIVDVLIIHFVSDNFAFTRHGLMMCLMTFVPIIMVDIMICLILYGVFGKKQREYRCKFKEIIISKLINNFYDNVEYFPKKQMIKRIYDEAEYNEYYNRYHSDDYIEAKVNNLYDIGIAEIHTVEETTRRDSKGNTHTSSTTKFHGLFAKIVIDKSIESTLKIQRNGKYSFNKKKLEMDSRGI